MLKLRALAVFALSAVIVSGAFADDPQENQKRKKKAAAQNRSPATQLLRQLEKAGVTLSEEQQEKTAALATALKKDLAEARKAGGLTPELLKKRAEAGKAARQAGQKGKELRAAVDAAVPLTDQQTEAMKSIAGKQQQFRKDFLAVLTDEQKEKLPAQLTRQGKKGKKAKAKKDAA
ncbi:hypothetical protein [Roseimaritima ulvae]|uniref:LTXXQ motif protein n=1 Tax=Roseimaritima ulvae TaxID=980254 RepID=A0A5B9QZ58_9BACT|nr:hypothetical protein [Roseimaritima ulvae]QEG39273.1 hypothetical protein UC8_12340 [Roseimaritima ulvae]